MTGQINIDVPLMADCASRNHKPEYLYWVGCAGAFDDRYRKVARAFTRILTHLKTDFAVLGTEESCTGDPARRAGNEMLFQMQAFANIETFGRYNVKKILTTCPHCFNVFKNEYPDLGGSYEVIHYADFLMSKVKSGELNIGPEVFGQTAITFHDPCYLGRANDMYEAPRNVLKSVHAKNTEMKRHGSFALCCGAGGAQMFKEAEKGNKEIFIERTEEALETGAGIIATACPFCMVMLTDGLKYKNREEDVRNLDLAEIVAEALGLQ